MLATELFDPKCGLFWACPSNSEIQHPVQTGKVDPGVRDRMHLAGKVAVRTGQATSTTHTSYARVQHNFCASLAMAVTLRSAKQPAAT